MVRSCRVHHSPSNATSMNGSLMSKHSESQDSTPAIPEELQQKFDMWLAHFKRRFPTESESKLRTMAAEFACMYRKERRRRLKISSPKLPRLLKVPKAKP